MGWSPLPTLRQSLSLFTTYPSRVCLKLLPCLLKALGDVHEPWQVKIKRRSFYCVRGLVEILLGEGRGHARTSRGMDVSSLACDGLKSSRLLFVSCSRARVGANVSSLSPTHHPGTRTQDDMRTFHVQPPTPCCPFRIACRSCETPVARSATTSCSSSATNDHSPHCSITPSRSITRMSRRSAAVDIFGFLL